MCSDYIIGVVAFLFARVRLRLFHHDLTCLFLVLNCIDFSPSFFNGLTLGRKTDANFFLFQIETNAERALKLIWPRSGESGLRFWKSKVVRRYFYGQPLQGIGSHPITSVQLLKEPFLYGL